MNNCLDYKENLLIYSRGSLEEALTAVTVYHHEVFDYDGWRW
jgi:hypothetical protein